MPGPQTRTIAKKTHMEPYGSCTLNFGLNYELIYQPDAIEYLFVYNTPTQFTEYTHAFNPHTHTTYTIDGLHT